MTTAIVSDAHYQDHDTGMHPECAGRLVAIDAALERRQLRAATLSLTPLRATRDDLLRVHDAQMIDQLEQACRTGEDLPDPDTVISPASFDVALLAAGGALTGIDALVAGQASNVFVSARPPGHHATPHRAMGFCLFNNIAIAARYAQAVHGVGRVLILDWDVHHGNGTQDTFYSDPSVYYVSWHQHRLYPGTGFPAERGAGPGEGFNRNVTFPAWTPAKNYLETFLATLLEVTRDFSPELVLLSAGFDAHALDPLASLLLEDTDFKTMTGAVLELAHRHAGGRLLSILEGGYNRQTLGDTVATHLEALLEA